MTSDDRQKFAILVQGGIGNPRTSILEAAFARGLYGPFIGALMCADSRVERVDFARRLRQEFIERDSKRRAGEPVTQMYPARRVSEMPDEEVVRLYLETGGLWHDLAADYYLSGKERVPAVAETSQQAVQQRMEPFWGGGEYHFSLLLEMVVYSAPLWLTLLVYGRVHQLNRQWTMLGKPSQALLFDIVGIAAAAIVAVVCLAVVRTRHEILRQSVDQEVNEGRLPVDPEHFMGPLPGSWELLPFLCRQYVPSWCFGGGAMNVVAAATIGLCLYLRPLTWTWEEPPHAQPGTPEVLPDGGTRPSNPGSGKRLFKREDE